MPPSGPSPFHSTSTRNQFQVIRAEIRFSLLRGLFTTHVPRKKGTRVMPARLINLVCCICCVCGLARAQTAVLATSTILDGKGGVLRNQRITIDGSRIAAMAAGQEG